MFTTKLTRFALAATALTLLASPAIADDCDFTSSFSETIDASGVTRVVIDASAGSLTVTGGAGEIKTRGTACTSRESALSEIRLDVERQGSTVRIKAVMPPSKWSFRKVQMKLDIEIEMPSGIAIDIEDGSGPIVVEGVGPLHIEDGSGSIELRRITGDLEIQDGSGSIDITDVRGDVEVSDGSGSVDVAKVTGDVRLEDGSGGIHVRNVDGNVVVERDGSGSIDVQDVLGNFTVDRDGSGGIHYHNIGGAIHLP